MAGNSPPVFLWTEPRVEQLIGLFKEWPNLWDTRDPGYRNRGRKMEAIKHISSIMDLDTVEVERKINILLTQFRRVHKKVLALRLAGREEEADRNIWYGYRQLSFLEDRFDASLSKEIKEEQASTSQPEYYEAVPQDDYVLVKDGHHKTIIKDEYDLYGEQIALKMKKMDPLCRAETQHRINCILHEAEMKLLKPKIVTPEIIKVKMPRFH